MSLALSLRGTVRTPCNRLFLDSILFSSLL